jgi:hypothetical protein
VKKSALNHLSVAIHDFLFRVRHGGENVWNVAVENDSVVLRKNDNIRGSIKFSDVESIEAINRQALIHVDIYLVFATPNETLWVGEFANGFENIAKEILGRYPEIREGWYGELNTKDRITVWRKE